MSIDSLDYLDTHWQKLTSELSALETERALLEAKAPNFCPLQAGDIVQAQGKSYQLLVVDVRRNFAEKCWQAECAVLTKDGHADRRLRLPQVHLFTELSPLGLRLIKKKQSLS